MWGAQQGLGARGLRRRLANAVRALASHVGNDHEQTKAGWLWFLKNMAPGSAGSMVHGTSLVARRATAVAPKEARVEKAQEAAGLFVMLN